jgi:hypothetical protein
MNTAYFKALKGYPVNWSAIGAKSIGMRVNVSIQTEHPITREYLDMIAEKLESVREPYKPFLYDVRPIYPK